MGDVGDRVVHLILGQRPPRPVGETMGLVGPMAGDALDQLVVGDGIPVTEHHGGDLGIENRVRNDPCLVPDDFNVLTGSVENLQHLLVAHQFEERPEVDALRQRIDYDCFRGTGHLHHAEQGIIGRLAQEFRIDSNDRVFREPCACRG